MEYSERPSRPISRIDYQIDFEFKLNKNLEHIVTQGHALGLEVSDRETGLIAHQVWLDYQIEFSEVDEESTRLIIRGLDTLRVQQGHYRIRAFFKEGEQNLSEHSDAPKSINCPVPRTLRTPVAHQDFDIAIGLWEGRIDHEQVISIQVNQQSCALGEKSTELSATVMLPEALSLQAQQRLMLHFSPINSTLHYPLTIPLKRFIQVQDSDQRLSFFVNEIPTGLYQLIVFVDSDGDALPSPCDLEQARGGDQWIANSVPTLEIESGVSYDLQEEFELVSVEACQSLLTMLGEIEDNPEQKAIYLAQVEMNSELVSALRFSPSQKLWFSKHRRKQSPEFFTQGQALFSLQEAIISEGRFSVHLNENEVLANQGLAIWIDEITDQANYLPSLKPCNNSAYLGIDTWWWQGGLEQFSKLLNIDLLSAPPLEPIGIVRRCEAPEALLEMSFNFNFTWPNLSSDRPLFLVFENLITGEILHSFLSDIQESDIDRERLIKRRLKSGSYQVNAYIDQNLDTDFQPCFGSVLGDRFSSSRAQIVSLNANEVKSISLNLNPRDCPYTRSEPNVRLLSYAQQDALKQADIGIWASETPICNNQEIFSRIKDLHNRVSEEDPYLFSGCLEYLDNELSLPSLPAGNYEMNVCLPIPSNTEVLISGDRCFRAKFWSAKASFNLNQAPSQTVELVVTPQCQCDP